MAGGSPKSGTNRLEVGFDFVGNVLGSIFDKLDALDVQLLRDQIRILFQAFCPGRIRKNDPHCGEWLPHLQFFPGSTSPAQRGDFTNQRHSLTQFLVHEAVTDLRVITEMHRLRELVTSGTNQRTIQMLGDKGDERSSQKCGRHQTMIESRLRSSLVRIDTFTPVTITSPAHIPVGEAIDKIIQCGGRCQIVMGIECLPHHCNGRVQLCQNPAIQIRQLQIFPGFSGQPSIRGPTIDAGVDGEEGIDIPKSQQEFSLALSDRLLLETETGPWGLTRIEEPTHGIRTFILEDVFRSLVVLEGLGHLCAVLPQQVTENDACFERHGPITEEFSGNPVIPPRCPLRSKQDRRD